MAETMQRPAPAAPAKPTPAEISQDIEMTNGQVTVPQAQQPITTESTVPSTVPAPAPAPAISQPPSHSYQPPPIAFQAPASAPPQTVPAQPSSTPPQQLPLPPIPTPNNLPPPNQSNLAPVNQVNNHVPPAPAHPGSQMHMGSIPTAFSAQPIAGYYSEMPANSQQSDGFELVSDGGGMLSGGRMGKKDVKRRTKTGCLTCRKRRIKVNKLHRFFLRRVACSAFCCCFCTFESCRQHPVCRNCEKSKRECLGYDPVFRSQPGPSVIQPAPSQTSFAVAAPPQVQQVPQIPPAPHVPQASQPASAPPPTPPVVSGQPSHSPSVPAATPPVTSPATQQPSQSSNVTSAAATVKSPSVPPTQEGYEHLLMANAIPECRNLQLQQISINDLLMVSGSLDPLPESLELPPTRVEECANFFMAYATSADIFLETHWFEANARRFLLGNKNLLSHVSLFLNDFMERKWVSNPECVPSMESREARIIWDTITLCRTAQAQNTNPDGGFLHESPELTLAVNRLKVLEALITGKTLETNPTSAPEYAGEAPAWAPAALAHQLKRSEMKFWDAMGQYLVITDDMPECNVLRDLALIDARAHLDLIENRDVIYSIAVIRHISRFQPRKVKNLPPSTDEKDVSAKLYVATKFIEEERDGKATNQVIRRLCAQLLRWWEKPENM
ncbi:predicted protein [Uncinocarpus reesii 1704]|uniref:Zn(2)-C6 fungal-type domain-containing protein n=1 Tax=Uncinocarpus reesii (strain UAMH 1704) TaxID=336963 RepID=C4JS85_UNCRE|nr:uncharacterized protein UREG_05324 [Uncinocarpus reesii 1704]EEP80482.1 predicted protein [Uncinocarpus reesii 1704]